MFGGALESNCYRDKFLKNLKETKSFLTIIPDKINYFDIASANYNLIDKETRLFENADILIIIPESAGSFAEIGMIAAMVSNHPSMKNKQKFAEKILVVLDEKYKYDESFIKLGPIKNIKKYGGKSVNVNFDSDNFVKIKNKFNFYQKKNKRVYLNEKNELFFLNCLKVLITIYYNKTISILENSYKTDFLVELKKIHSGITEDNIEYLESTELINKKNNAGEIIIEVNFQHNFIQDLINLNFDLFNRHRILYGFLKESGY